MKLDETAIIAAILTPAALQNAGDPERVVSVYEAIRKRLKERGNETITVPKALEPLLKSALEEKTRRQRETQT